MLLTPNSDKPYGAAQCIQERMFWQILSLQKDVVCLTARIASSALPSAGGSRCGLPASEAVGRHTRSLLLLVLQP